MALNQIAMATPYLAPEDLVQLNDILDDDEQTVGLLTLIQQQSDLDI